MSDFDFLDYHIIETTASSGARWNINRQFVLVTNIMSTLQLRRWALDTRYARSRRTASQN